MYESVFRYVTLINVLTHNNYNKMYITIYNYVRNVIVLLAILRCIA